VPPSIDIRRATPADLGALRALLTVLHDAPPWAADRDGAARAAFERMLADELRCVLLGFVDGAPAGTVDTVVVPNLTREASSWAAIENVIVLPEHRRLGVGRRLIDAAIDFAAQHGCYKVQLVSATTRREAHALYRAAGFDADVAGYRRYLGSGRDES
jgi:ribosomal protein S18 acetylase RimI-like enzyme